MGRLLLVLLLLTACSQALPAGRAAEPAVAPRATTPAGLVVHIGSEAEGVAVDPVTHLAAVAVRAPFGIALVDTRTGSLVTTVPVPGHARHLALQGDHVLVPVEDSGQLLFLDLATRTVDAAVPTADYPHGVTSVGDVAIVANERGRRLSLVRDGRVVAVATGFVQPGGLVAGPDAVYVVDVAASTLTALTLPGLKRRRSVAAGKGPTHAVRDRRGDIVVVDTRGSRLLVYSPDLRELRAVDLPGTPYGIAYDDVRDALWVTLTARNEVVSLRGSDLRELRRLPTVRQPNTVSVDTGTGTVVVASRTDGLLELIPA